MVLRSAMRLVSVASRMGAASSFSSLSPPSESEPEEEDDDDDPEPRVNTIAAMFKIDHFSIS